MRQGRKEDERDGLTIRVRRAPRDGRRAILQAGGLTFEAALGRSGTTVFKREGDGGTPVGLLRILGGYRRVDRIKTASSSLPLRSIRKRDLWCDEARHPSYNRAVTAPFLASHEEMMREDGVYDICLVLDWNITCRKRHRGSAIFFHLNQPGYTPTAGCIAVSRRAMLRLLPFLRRGTRVIVEK